MVDAGEAKILERPGAQRLEKLHAGRIRVERAACDLLEQILKMFV